MSPVSVRSNADTGSTVAAVLIVTAALLMTSKLDANDESAVVYADDASVGVIPPSGFKQIRDGFVNVAEGASLFVSDYAGSRYEQLVTKDAYSRLAKRKFKETSRTPFTGAGEGMWIRGRRVDGAMITLSCTLAWKDDKASALIEFEIPENSSLPYASSPCDAIRGVTRR